MFAAAIAGAAASGSAAPVWADQASELLDADPGSAAVTAIAEPAPLESILDASQALLDAATDELREGSSSLGYRPRAPTWIQNAVLVNPGDFPDLDPTAANAEREIQTLEWLIEDQRQRAAEQTRRSSAAPGAEISSRWWKNLLPAHWLAAIKDHRGLVAAAGGALLLMVWLLGAVAARPARVPVAAPPTAPPGEFQTRVGPTRRRRRRLHR